MDNDMESIAKAVEQKLYESNGTFSLNKSTLYAIGVDGSAKSMIKGGDIYNLLESPQAKALAKEYDYIGIMSTGWATPIDETEIANDIRPSQSPNRSRVRVFVMSGKGNNKIATVIRFQKDSSQESVTSAKGPLCDAFMNMLDQDTNN